MIDEHFLRPYLLTDGRSLWGVIVFAGRPGCCFIYDEGVGRKIRQDSAFFVFWVWFLSIGRGVILMDEGSFWNGNCGFRVEVVGFLG